MEELKLTIVKTTTVTINDSGVHLESVTKEPSGKTIDEIASKKGGEDKAGMLEAINVLSSLEEVKSYLTDLNYKRMVEDGEVDEDDLASIKNINAHINAIISMTLCDCIKKDKEAKANS